MSITSSDEILEAVSQVNLFSGVRKAALRKLVKNGHRLQYRPGETVTEEGEKVQGWAEFSPTGAVLHLVLEGSGSVLVHGQPRATIGPGDYVGEVALIDGKPRSATIVAGDDGLTTFAISSGSFHRLLEEQPQVAVAMLPVLASRLRSVET
jgi:CRP/FNR family cyclic AMP-dependent transcriptional regulator